MTAGEPLWRGKTKAGPGPSSELKLHWIVDCPPETEVAVVRVDSLPTRQEVRRAISQAGYSPEYAYRRARTRIDRMTDAVMFLLGQTEEDDR
jgi:hypothetical protein